MNYALKMHVMHNRTEGQRELACVTMGVSDNWDYIIALKKEREYQVSGLDGSNAVRQVYDAILKFNPDAGAVHAEFRIHA